MSEIPNLRGYEFSRAELLHTADRLFDSKSYVSHPMVVAVGDITGVVAPEVDRAVKAE